MRVCSLSRRAGSIIPITLTLLLASASPVQTTSSPRAATRASLVVTKTADTDDGVCDSDCSLREAITAANADAAADTITFAAGVVGTINLSGALPKLKSMTITGPGAGQLTVRRTAGAATRFRVFTTELFETVNISGLTVSGGLTSSENGGGIYNSQSTTLNLSNVVVTGNATGNETTGSGSGGGIFNDGNLLTLTDSTVSGNSAASGHLGGDEGGDAGGIYQRRGVLTITNSTISGNNTGDSTDINRADGNGGGLYVSGGTVALVNSTVSGNATGAGANTTRGGRGGGIFRAGGTLTLTNCTVAHNTVGGAGGTSGGGGIDGGISFTLRNTIVANNTATFSPDLRGTVNSQDFNLIGDAAGATITGTTTHNITGVDPRLSPLQDNGGPTRTHALLPGSPAIDSGNSSGSTTDQRGLTRPVDTGAATDPSDGSDIGAFEVQLPSSAGQIQFSAGAYSVAENAGPAAITVTRTGGSAGAVSVTFSTSGGTAAPGSDYTPVTGFTVAFADGDAAPKTVLIPITDDALNEPDETVNLTLSNPTGGATLVGSPATAALTILDDDPPPALSVNDVTVNEGNAGDSPATFTVTLSAPSSKTVRVLFSTSSGTAMGGQDYTPILSSETLTFAPGETTKTVTVAARGDAQVEPDETFFLILAHPSNATISKAQGRATIIDDDAPPTRNVRFGEAAYSANEGDGAVTITVTRAGDISGEAAVDYTTSDGTADQRTDYTVALGRLRFAPGQAARNFTVLLTDDRFDDDAETVLLTLSNASGEVAGATSRATLTINDDDSADGPSPVRWDSNFDTEFFVRRHYHDFLNREPDPPGLRFWTNQIAECGGRPEVERQGCREVRSINVSAAFFLSIEFQQTGFFAIRAHRAAFRRKSEDFPSRFKYLELVSASRQIGAGVIVGQDGWQQRLEANLQDYAVQLVSDARFVSRYPTSMNAEEYVDALFFTAEVTPTTQERQTAVDAFATAGGGTAGRAAALRKVAESETLRAAEFQPAFVLMEYFGYMRRDPDQPGYFFWLQKLRNHGGDYIRAEMVKAFIVSGEYQGRFGR